IERGTTPCRRDVWQAAASRLVRPSSQRRKCLLLQCSTSYDSILSATRCTAWRELTIDSRNASIATVRIRGPLGRAPQQATLISRSVGDKARSVIGRPKSQPSLMAPEPIAETHAVAAKKKSPPWRDGEVNVYVFTDLPDETTDKTKEFLVDDPQKLEMDIDHTA